MSWIQTYTGKQFYPLDPDHNNVCIEDIAHALSMNCRFNGHCKKFYSVAEHSVYVSYYVRGEYALNALLHDAAEAYISDLTRPVKHQIKEYRDIETNLDSCISVAFGLWAGLGYDEIKEIDNKILMDERIQLFDTFIPWSNEYKPIGVNIECWTPAQAEDLFLKRFKELTP